jgi:3-dehydroquinate synthase
MVDRSFVVPFTHRLRFTESVFDGENEVLLQLLERDERGPARVMVVLDEGLLRAVPGLRDEAEAFLRARPDAIAPAGPVRVVPGGEVCKNDPAVLQGLLAAMHEERLCRRSYVLVVGGGAVLDVVGYGAGVFHRGIRLVRVPSTTLAQADSGVGVKNAVNAFGTKNLVGTFAPPWGVVNDEALLRSLSDEFWRDGFAECVKVSLLKDAGFYERVWQGAGRLRARDMRAAIPVIRRSAELHLEHITSGGDPFEFRHARPLDFGHWAAHKLEQLTKFELSHGHAVSIGVALDCLYAELCGEARPGLAEDVVRCLVEIGLPVWHPLLDRPEAVLAGLEEFREHLGGMLTITLVRAPGDAFEVHTIDHATMARAARGLREIEARVRSATWSRRPGWGAGESGVGGGGEARCA